jgi:hypothetical protein
MPPLTDSLKSRGHQCLGPRRAAKESPKGAFSKNFRASNERPPVFHRNSAAQRAIVSRVTVPMLANANPLRFNSTIPSTATSYREEAETVTVCVTSALSVNDTRQVLDTHSRIGEEGANG